MKHLKIVPVLLVAALIAFNPGGASSRPKESPKKPAKPKVEIPKLVFKNPTQIGERWASIYIEGRKVGWKHVVRSKVFFKAKKVFLFEETSSVKIGKVQCDIKRRAITDTKYCLVAFESVEETGARKITNRGVTPLISDYAKAAGIEEVWVSREVNDKTRKLSHETTEAVETAGASRLMPLFALIDIYLDMSPTFRRSLPKTLYLFDTINLTDKTAYYQYVKKYETERGGKKVKMDAFAAAIDGEPQYWLLDDSSPVYWLSLHYPLTMRAAEREDDAARPGGSDPDFKADPALSPGQYNSDEIGLVFKRVLGDWMIRSHRIDGNLASIRMKGLISRHTMAMLSVNHLPKGIKPADAEKRIRELMIENGLVKSIPDPGEAKTVRGEIVFSCEVREKSGAGKSLGQYRCWIKDDRISAAVFMIPADYYDENQAKALDTLVKSVLLKQVMSAPQKFSDKAKRITIKGCHPSWQFKERQDGGVDLSNPWYFAKGDIFGMERPKGVSDQDLLKTAMRDLPRGGTRKETKIPGIRADKIYEIRGVKTEFGKKYLVKAWFIIGQKYVYRLKVQMPVDMDKTAAPEIERILSKMDLKLR